MEDDNDEPPLDNTERSPSIKKKKKKKSKNNKTQEAVDDAIEKRLRQKRKKEKAALDADRALEEKIRKRKAAVQSQAVEEEKAEECNDDGYEPRDSLPYFRSNGAAEADTEVGTAVSKSHRGNESHASIRSGSGASFSTRRGGGDVRHRPPPSLGNRSQQLDLLRTDEEAMNNKQNLDPRYADFFETGQWGTLSKWEKRGLCLFSLALVAVAIGLAITFSKEKVTESPTMSPIPPTDSPTASPTPAPTDINLRETTGFDLMKRSSPNLTLIFENPEDLVGAKLDPFSTPQQIAAEFVLFDDGLQIPAQDARFIERYTLAVFYYSNGGCSGDWIETSNWMMMNIDHCEWFGVVCDIQGRVTELSMPNNYVTGKLPIEFGQLRNLSTLDLSNNRMGGTIPPISLAMSSLYSLRLMNNDFSGDFPFTNLMKANTSLDNLWIQENSKLSGEITLDYCGLFTITLDCDNFEPQPTYTASGNLTTFEENCMQEKGKAPVEYTCNFDMGVPVTRPSSTTVNNSTNCGTPGNGV